MKLNALALPIVAVIFPLVSFWRIHEDDIFWQIKAGYEMLSSYTLPTVDTWSYTVKGKPWVNYQWLSSVVFALGHKVLSFEYLNFLRAVLILVWFSLIGILAIHKDNSSKSLPVGLLLLPFVFVGCLFRLHLRPEMFTLIGFTLLLSIYTRRQWNGEKKSLLGAAIVATAANFHGGTGILILALSLQCLTCQSGVAITRRVALGLVNIAAFFMTPLGINIIKPIINHAGYSNELLFNTEWQPVSLGLLDVRTQGWPVAIWFCGLVLGWTSYFTQLAAGRKLPGVYKVPFFVVAGGIFWTALSFYGIRFIPYQVLFFLPVFGNVLVPVSSSKKPTQYRLPMPLKYTRFTSLGFLIFVSGAVLPLEVYKHRSRLGFGINRNSFPVGLMDFVVEHRPEREIFSSFEVGGYQVWAAPEYPVFADPRDVIFNSVKESYSQAHDQPGIMHALMDLFKVKTAIIRQARVDLNPDGSFSPTLQLFFPKSKWGLVYFDNVHALFLKRIPEHQNILAAHEYTILHPSMPLFFYQGLAKSDDQSARVGSEIDRCLLLEPGASYCLAASAYFHHRVRDDLKSREKFIAAMADATEKTVTNKQYFKAAGLLGR